MSVELTETQRDDVLVIGISGRLDAAASPLVEKKINAHIDNGQTKLVLDFSGVEYLSSAGMRLLLAVSKKLAGMRGKLALAALVNEVMDVMKMAGFDHLLELYPDVDKALASFSG